MIVTQHMPECRASLVGLPCGCSRTELTDPPTNRAPRERWERTGDVYDMGDGERVYVYRKSGPGRIITTGLSTTQFSRPTRDYSFVKTSSTIRLSDEPLSFETNMSALLVEQYMAFIVARADTFLLYGQDTPFSDTERALRNLERPIDYTTDRQRRRARRHQRWVDRRRRLAERLLPADYYIDREDY